MLSSVDGEGSQSRTIVVVAISLVALSFIAVLLRLISRVALLRRPTLDDLFIVMAWVAMSYALLSLHLSNHLLVDRLGSVHCDVSRSPLRVRKA